MSNRRKHVCFSNCEIFEISRDVWETRTDSGGGSVMFFNAYVWTASLPSNCAATPARLDKHRPPKTFLIDRNIVCEAFRALASYPSLQTILPFRLCCSKMATICDCPSMGSILLSLLVSPPRPVEWEEMGRGVEI